ncbi:sulfur-oxidizing protein SoxY [Hyphomicrobium sp. 1Nfss2.1]|uniref:thiosulfate oxidation carrier protein SoxY n=1 Tax=Hyphomicrobium sp. 1Nfss2.1 TaxID=3413936 RepID=UPI003C7D58C5
MNETRVTRSRRDFLMLSVGGLAAVALSATSSHVQAAVADVDTIVTKLTAGKKVADGRIAIELPSIAENGLVVPLNFTVESPMTADDYVKAVHILADGNPNPQIADFAFTPMSPKASAQIRIRLAKTQNVIVVAEMSNGDFYSTKKEVKVTIGGCGG